MASSLRKVKEMMTMKKSKIRVEEDVGFCGGGGGGVGLDMNSGHMWESHWWCMDN